MGLLDDVSQAVQKENSGQGTGSIPAPPTGEIGWQSSTPSTSAQQQIPPPPTGEIGWTAPTGLLDQVTRDVQAENQKAQDEREGKTPPPVNGSAEEQAFLKSNPDYQWVPKDASRPNTQPGIYHNSEVADMKKDPTMSHSPVDLHFVSTTLKSAAAATALVGGGVLGAQAIAAIPEVIPAVLPHTIAGVKALGAWADAHPVHAYMLYNVLKELLPGAKKAIGIVKGVPEVE